MITVITKELQQEITIILNGIEELDRYHILFILFCLLKWPPLPNSREKVLRVYLDLPDDKIYGLKGSEIKKNIVDDDSMHYTIHTVDKSFEEISSVFYDNLKATKNYPVGFASLNVATIKEQLINFIQTIPYMSIENNVE